MSERFKSLAYSGSIIHSPWWGKIVIDCAGITTEPRIPILREHTRDRCVGFADWVTNNPDGLFVGGLLLESTRDGQEVSRLLGEGFPLQASVGAQCEEVEEVAEGERVPVNNIEFAGPGFIWRRSYIREVSVCSLGADSATSVQKLSQGLSSVVRPAAGVAMQQTMEILAMAKAEWSRDAALRAEFNDDYDAFRAYTKAVDSGLGRIYGETVLSRLTVAEGGVAMNPVDDLSKRARGRWNSNPALRAEFGDDFDRFFHYLDAMAKGRVRLVSNIPKREE